MRQTRSKKITKRTLVTPPATPLAKKKKRTSVAEKTEMPTTSIMSAGHAEQSPQLTSSVQLANSNQKTAQSTSLDQSQCTPQVL